MYSRRTFAKTIAAAALCASLPFKASAHRQKHALTSIVWNERDKILEITHDLHAHDAELVLARQGLIDKPDLTGLRARAQLALYTKKHFQLKTLAGENIELSILGAETDSRFAHVYMEASLSQKPLGFLITDTLLQDIFVDQTNQVNIDFGQKVNSAVFVVGDGQKKVLA